MAVRKANEKKNVAVYMRWFHDGNGRLCRFLFIFVKLPWYLFIIYIIYIFYFYIKYVFDEIKINVDIFFGVASSYRPKLQS